VPTLSKFLTVLLFCFLTLTTNVAQAQIGNLRLVRDAEIEHILALYAKPLFKAAGLQPGAVKTYLVQDPTLNAFVAGGQRIFVFTGLILATRHPGELVGVLAHETGHIRGGHLARTRDAIDNAQTISIIAALLGGVAAAASGNGDAAVAGVLGGSSAGTQLFLSHSRSQESSADQAAVNLMELAGWSPEGIVNFLEILEGQDLLLGQRGNPYLRSHPLSFDRIEALRARVEQSPLRDLKPIPELVHAHSMMQAKLSGFVNSPADTFRRFPENDTSDQAHYARAVAFMKQARTIDAVTEMKPLLAKEPENPYLHELHGQILLEGGRIEDALPPLQRALALSSHPTIAVLLARAQIALGGDAANNKALEILEPVVHVDPDFPAAWEQLAIAYGRTGKLGKSMLAGAEQYVRTGQIEFASEQVERALRTLPEGSPDHFRALDIQLAIRNARRNSR